MRIDTIKDTILKIDFVENLIKIQSIDDIIIGKVSINFEGLDKPLLFDFIINKQYPLKSYNSETLTFYNEELIEYNHVMGSGSICIHTSHHIKLEEKVRIDFYSLKQWIVKYYINNEKDDKYEHIIVSEQMIEGRYHSYLFTDVNYKFSQNEYGEVNLSFLSQSTYRSGINVNFIVNNFKSKLGTSIKNQWSSFYQNLNQTNKGLFVYIKEHPAKFQKFAFNNWKELKELLPNDFIYFLHKFEKENLKRFKNLIIPIFIGYGIQNQDIHWQVALIKVGNFPINGFPILLNDKKTGKWGTEIIEQNIIWGITRNSSYKYFFGRGTLTEKITKSKILIIGIGAIGSMVAKTLVKGGCKYIDVVDYDIKEPENVCRSEYLFSTGLTNKTDELMKMLIENSPFVETKLINNLYFENIKRYFESKEAQEIITKELNNYDIIFDCTTDDDLMHIFDNIKVSSDIINLSITNHANELVGAFYPNQYSFITRQFNEVLNNDDNDLYEPTGCWSPTFKASYNDINSFIQLALKHINKIYEKNKNRNNFIISQDNNTIKIQEF